MNRPVSNLPLQRYPPTMIHSTLAPPTRCSMSLSYQGYLVGVQEGDPDVPILNKQICDRIKGYWITVMDQNGAVEQREYLNPDVPSSQVAWVSVARGLLSVISFRHQQGTPFVHVRDAHNNKSQGSTSAGELTFRRQLWPGGPELTVLCQPLIAFDSEWTPERWQRTVQNQMTQMFQ